MKLKRKPKQFMKLRRKYRPELIASKDATRFVINDLQISEHEGKPVLVATDGRKLVVVPVALEENEKGRLPKAALIFARKHANRKDDITMRLNGKVEFPNGWTMPLLEEGNYPTWQQVVPSKESRKTRIAFNARFLYELAQAMGAEEVVLHMGDPMEAIIVEPGVSDGEFGVLMPCRLSK